MFASVSCSSPLPMFMFPLDMVMLSMELPTMLHTALTRMYLILSLQDIITLDSNNWLQKERLQPFNMPIVVTHDYDFTINAFD